MRMGLYMTTPQFAKAIGVSKNTVINWEKQGFVKPHHISPTGRRYYSHEQAEELVSHKQEGTTFPIIPVSNDSSDKVEPNIESEE